MKTIRLIAIILSLALLLSACGLFPPVPGSEQTTQAITASNNAQGDPLEQVCEEMQVSHHHSGKAGAVLWMADEQPEKFSYCV